MNFLQDGAHFMSDTLTSLQLLFNLLDLELSSGHSLTVGSCTAFPRNLSMPFLPLRHLQCLLLRLA